MIENFTCNTSSYDLTKVYSGCALYGIRSLVRF